MLFHSGISLTGITVLSVILLSVEQRECTHITGTFNTNEFFRFLNKFGFQQMDIHTQRDSYGYIFGNATSRKNSSKQVTLAVLDRNLFLEYYGNRTIKNKNLACSMMFKNLNESSYDSECNVDGRDLLR